MFLSSLLLIWWFFSDQKIYVVNLEDIPSVRIKTGWKQETDIQIVKWL